MENYFQWLIDEKTGFRKLLFTYETQFNKEFDKFINYVGKTKICSKCKQEFPATTYFFCSGGKILHRYCKKCEGAPNYGWGRIENYKLNELGFHYCSKCDRILPLNNFYFGKTNGRCNRTGFSSNCKECTNSSFGLNDLINENKEFLSIKDDYKICQKCLLELPNTDYYFFKKNDRKNGSCICKKCKGSKYGVFMPNVVYKDSIPEGFIYCATCGELIELKDVAGQGLCKKCCKEKNKIYNQKTETKSYKRSFVQKRRAKKKKLRNDLTQEEWQETLKFFDNSCVYCGISEEEHIKQFGHVLHQDHVIPLSKDGEYTKNNIIPACRSCNYSKCDSSLMEFYNQKEDFSSDKLNNILLFLEKYKNY